MSQVCNLLGCTAPIRAVYTGGVGLCLTHAHERGDAGRIHPKVLPPLPALVFELPTCTSRRCLVAGCLAPHEARGCCEMHAIILRNAPSMASAGVLEDSRTRRALQPYWPDLIEPEPEAAPEPAPPRPVERRAPPARPAPPVVRAAPPAPAPVLACPPLAALSPTTCPVHPTKTKGPTGVCHLCHSSLIRLADRWRERRAIPTGAVVCGALAAVDLDATRTWGCHAALVELRAVLQGAEALPEVHPFPDPLEPAPVPDPSLPAAEVDASPPAETAPTPVVAVSPTPVAAVAAEEPAVSTKPKSMPCPVHLDRRTTRYGVCDACISNLTRALGLFSERGLLPAVETLTTKALLALDLDQAHEKGWKHHAVAVHLRDLLLQREKVEVARPHPQPAIEAAPTTGAPQATADTDTDASAPPSALVSELAPPPAPARESRSLDGAEEPAALSVVGDGETSSCADEDGEDAELVCGVLGLVMELPPPLSVVERWSVDEREAALDWSTVAQAYSGLLTEEEAPTAPACLRPWLGIGAEEPPGEGTEAAADELVRVDAWVENLVALTAQARRLRERAQVVEHNAEDLERQARDLRTLGAELRERAENISLHLLQTCDRIEAAPLAAK